MYQFHAKRENGVACVLCWLAFFYRLAWTTVPTRPNIRSQSNISVELGSNTKHTYFERIISFE